MFEVPYIDRAGKESLFPVARWECHPLQYVGTVVATKFDRIMSILRHRYKWRKAKAFREQAFSAAAVSAITNSTWVIDRFLGVSRVFSKKKISAAIVRACVRNLDDNQRFVYSQVWKQTNWLTSRSERPRDKSKGSVDSARQDLRLFLDPTVPCTCNNTDCLYGIIPGRFLTQPAGEDYDRDDTHSLGSGEYSWF